MMRPLRRARRAARRAFSLVEFLVALVISGTLLAACVSALDASFKSYESTTEQASQQMVARLVVNRLLSVIRTGEQFGPYPVNPILTPEITTNSIEFVSVINPDTNTRQVWSIAREPVEGPEGPFRLAATVEVWQGDTQLKVSTEPLLWNVQECRFTLEYDVGPRLRRATIDLTIARDVTQQDAVRGLIEIPVTRLVASVSPRRLD